MNDPSHDAVNEPSHDALSAAFSVLARELVRELAPAVAELVRNAAATAPRAGQQDEQGGEQYLSVGETCKRFGISRATFDRTLRDSSSGLTEVIVRLPPVTGRVKVPLQAFEAWLRERPQRRRPRRGGKA